MGLLPLVGEVVSALVAAQLVGVVVQALEAYLGGELPALLVLLLGCFRHTS